MSTSHKLKWTRKKNPKRKKKRHLVLWGLTEDWNSITVTWIAVFYLRNAYTARMLYGKDPIWVSGSFFNKETRWEFHRQTEALFLELHRKSTCLENSLLDLTGKSEASSMPWGRWPTTQSYHSHSGISLGFHSVFNKRRSLMQWSHIKGVCLRQHLDFSWQCPTGKENTSHTAACRACFVEEQRAPR